MPRVKQEPQLGLEEEHLEVKGVAYGQLSSASCASSYKHSGYGNTAS